MARNLAHKLAFTDRSTDDSASAGGRKDLLTRRSMLQTGAVASVAGAGVGRLSVGGSANTGESSAFLTDFSEYDE